MYGNNQSEGLIYGKVLREARNLANLALVSLTMGGEE